MRYFLCIIAVSLSFSQQARGLSAETDCDSFFISLISNVSQAIHSGNLTNLSLPPYILANSGHFLNDLGLYQQCSAEETSRYLLIRLKIGSLAGFLGFCGPSFCEESYYNRNLPIIDALFSRFFSSIYNTSLTVGSVFQDPQLQHPKLDGFAIFVLFLVFFLLFLCFCGTLCEVYARFLSRNLEKTAAYELLPSQIPQKPENKLQEFLQCFSLLSNCEKILSTRESADQRLDIFNGVRFFSMCWVILGHTYMLRIMMSYNFEYLSTMSTTPGFTTIVNAGLYAVDVFFFIGGFFVAYVLTQKFEDFCKRLAGSSKALLFGKVYFHRIYRIWPSYALCVLVLYKLAVFVWSGPAWSSFAAMTKECEGKWWTNLLYIDNLFGRDTSDYCFAWGWYLSNDFQMFLVSPALIFLYVSRKRLAVCLMFLLLGLSLFSSFLISFLNGFKADRGANTDDNLNFFNLYYSKPWVRCDVYIYGLLIGLFYLEFHRSNGLHYQRVKTVLKSSYLLHFLCYFFGLALVNLVIWCVAGLQSSGDIHYWNDTEHVFYLIFNRIAFVCGVSLLLLPGLLTGNDVIHGILGYKLFAPLGRLTYCTYLVHLILLARTTFGTEQSFYASNESFVYVALADLVFCLFAGFALSAVAEVPLLNIEKKFIFKRGSGSLVKKKGEGNEEEKSNLGGEKEKMGRE